MTCHPSDTPGPGSTWPEEFAEDYGRWTAAVTADVPFYVELARAANGPVVELAVGDGRVAIPVALATGRPVIGIDTSPAMLNRAQAHADQRGAKLELRQCDMREFVLTEPAALVYCPFNALLHLPTWSSRRRTFERVFAALRPNGRFAWDALAFDHRLAAQQDGQRSERPLPHTIRYSVAENRVDLIREGGAVSSLWWATKNEWLGLLEVSGLELEALYGGFRREPLSENSREYVFVAQRRTS